MFTGIIQHVGRVVRVSPAPRASGPAAAHPLEVDLGPLADGLAPGASVAVNGACLTAAEIRRPLVRFDIVPETWRRTTLSRLRIDDVVNLERSLRVGDPLDGHFVQGHVDGVGAVARVERAGEWRLCVRCPAELLDFITPKGSIAVDGVSLTVVEATPTEFSVALVPTTLERTTLGRRQPGDPVNLETDLLARLVARRLGAAHSGAAAPLSWERLASEGYL